MDNFPRTKKELQNVVSQITAMKYADDYENIQLKRELQKERLKNGNFQKRIDRMHFRRKFSVADYDKENEEFEYENNELKSENVQLKQTIVNDRIIYEAERDAAKSKFDDLTKNVETLNQTIKDKDDEIAKLIIENDTKIKELNDGFEAERKKFCTVIKGLELTVQNLNEKYAELEVKEQKALKAAANFESQIKRLEHEIKQMNINRQTPKRSNSEDSNKFNEIFGDIDKYVFLQDVVIDSKIDYKRLTDKKLVVKNLFSTLKPGYWQVCSTMDPNEPVKNLQSSKKFKLHLNGRLSILFGQAHVSSLLQYVSLCNLIELKLGSQTLSWAEYFKLVSTHTIKYIELKKCIINDDEGVPVEHEKLLKELPNMEICEIVINDKEATEKTTKTFSQSLPFTKLRKFSLGNLPENFDLKVFAAFIKRHPNVEFHLRFKKTSKNAQNRIHQARENYLDKSFKICIDFA